MTDDPDLDLELAGNRVDQALERVRQTAYLIALTVEDGGDPTPRVVAAFTDARRAYDAALEQWNAAVQR